MRKVTLGRVAVVVLDEVGTNHDVMVGTLGTGTIASEINQIQPIGQEIP